MKRMLPMLLIFSLAWLLFRPASEAVAQKQPAAIPANKSSNKPVLLNAPFDQTTALKKQQEWARYLGKQSHIEKNSIGMELVLIPPGEYMRGSSDAEIDKFLSEDKDLQRKFFAKEQPRHRVRITKPYWLGRTEVTQAQWKAVMGTEPWKGKDYVKEGNDHPAKYVSWDDAQEFVKKLNAKEGGAKYRLPTEAEWEHACRAGTTTGWSFGDEGSDLGKFAWYGAFSNGSSKGEKYAHRVGQKQSNPFGLSDMHGNVWEWCSDWYDEKEYQRYASETAVDPSGPQTEQMHRVLRGGCWNSYTWNASSTSRFGFTPGYRYNGYGFRVLRTP